MILGIEVFFGSRGTFTCETSHTLTRKVKRIVSFDELEAIFLNCFYKGARHIASLPDLKDTGNIIGLSIDFKTVFW